MNYSKSGVRAKQRALNSKTKKWGRKFGLSLAELTLAAFIGLIICGVAAGIGLYKGILATTPRIRISDIAPHGEATIAYDCLGNELDQYVSANANRIQINDLDLIPQDLADAFVALEDRRFYQHNGIDFEGIARAGFVFVTSLGKKQQGASTITQQLLKNTIFTTWTEEGTNFIKKMKRKLQEQYLALEVSKYSSKEDVLLRYMNVINLGQNTLGVESASLRYFGKSCSELTLSECAVIASITQNPSSLNPISHPKANAERRLKCLNNMLEQEYISKAEYDEAIADTDAVYERISEYNNSYRNTTNTAAGSYFSDALYNQVLKDLIEDAGYNEIMAETMLTSGGLRIWSTMDPAIQAIADEEFANPDNYPADVKWLLSYALTIYTADGGRQNFSRENMMSWFKKNINKNFNLIFTSQDAAYEAIATYRSAMLAELGVTDNEDNYVESVSMTAQPQAAVAIEDQSTGYVVAIVGGRGAKEGRRTLNRATDAKRSPGSTFKVLAAFAPALDSAGQTLATVYNDAPFNYNDGVPVRNWYTTGYRGINSIRQAIRQSMNIVAVKTETVITPQLGYDYLLKFGFTTLTDGVIINNKFYTDVNQPLALGGLTYGATPYELNAAYAAIANMGNYVEPKLYSKVTDVNGNVILDNTHPKSTQVLKETTAFLLTDAMVDVVHTGGTAVGCNFNSQMAIAGKTGTSTSTYDVWFAGYTPYYTCSVWTGYDNNVTMNKNEDDISKNLWRAIMMRIHENLPNAAFPTPQGIVTADICNQSGLLPIEGICDPNCIVSELFAEGTVPTESCNVHYQGYICDYDHLPATADCPFPIWGTTVLPLKEDISLLEGSSMIIENPDGTQSVINNLRTNDHCQHDFFFYSDPGYEILESGQLQEIIRRDEAAGIYDKDYGYPRNHFFTENEWYDDEDDY